jgi:hypothetical protein
MAHTLFSSDGCRSAGLPQYGQLGHGTDNEYNSKEGSVRLVYEAQPRPRAISSLATKTVIKVACGNNHSGLFWPSLYPDSPSPCLSLLTGSMQTLNTSPNRCT